MTDHVTNILTAVARSAYLISELEKCPLDCKMKEPILEADIVFYNEMNSILKADCTFSTRTR